MIIMIMQIIRMAMIMMMLLMMLIMMYGHPTHPQWFEHQSVDTNLLTPSLPLRLFSLQSRIVFVFGVAANIGEITIHPM